MTQNRSARPADDDPGQTDWTRDVDGYRWNCPFCGTSRSNPAGVEADEGNAVTAIRSHVLASAGEGHGPENAYPEGFDPTTLADHVVRVDRRGDPVESTR